MITLDETIAKEKEEAKRLRKIIETGYDGEISIEAIFCDDTDAIKEVYERFENCAKEHEQLAELLEELKALRNGLKIKCDSLNEALDKGKKIGYNKAIDECLAVLYKNAGKIISIRFYEQIFDEMKQLKAGVENND